MPIVELNGQPYVAERLLEYLLDPLSEARRNTGVQVRSDNTKVNKYVFSEWSHFGQPFQRLHRDRAAEEFQGHAPSHISLIRDADLETRFPSMMTLPLLNQTETHASPADHLVSYEHFKSELIALFEKDYDSGNTTETVSRKYNASNDTWEDVSTADPTFNTGNSNTAENSAAAIDVNITVSSNAKRILIAWVISDDANPPSATFGGDSLTSLVNATQGACTATMLYLVDPPSGAGTCSVTPGGTGDHVVIVADFYNVDQRSPFRSSDSATFNTLPAAVNARVLDDDLVVGAIGHRPGSGSIGTITAGTGQTEIQEASVSTLLDGEASYERASANSSAFDHSYSTDGTDDDFVIVYGVLAAPNSSLAFADATAVGIRAFASTLHKGRMYAVGSAGGSTSNEKKYMVWSSPDGATWVEEDGTNWPTDDFLTTTRTRRNDFKDHMADIMDDGNNLIVALYEDPDSDAGQTAQVHIGYSADKGTTWTFPAGLVISCSTTPNIRFRHFRDPFGSDSLLPTLITSENVFLLDITNDTYEALLGRNLLTGTDNEALGATVGQDNALYISKETGDILRIAVTGTSSIEVNNIGPQTRARGVGSDGLVSARQGHANYIYGGDPTWLFVCYGGNAANKNGSIFAMEYTTQVWHSFYKDGTQNQDTYQLVISTEDDGTTRLHAATEGSSAASCFMFEEPLVSAVTGVTQQFKATGYIEWAEDDLGDPHADSAVFTGRVDADDLDDAATVEAGDGTNTVHIEHEYGIDGAAWTNVSNFGFYVSDDKVLYFGKTFQNTDDQTSNPEAGDEKGVSCKTIRNRLVFYRDGTNTNTPKLKEFQIEARNKLVVLNGWEVDVDLGDCMGLQGSDDPETVVSNLKTVSDTVELVQWKPGSALTTWVEMVRGSLQVELVEMGSGDGLQLGRRGGRARFTVEEVLDTS